MATDPLALLIGFALDQQVTVQKAFSGPADLKRRLGHLDAARIAAMDPGELDTVFRERPPSIGSRARWPARSRPCARRSATGYGDDAARVWTEAREGRRTSRRGCSGCPGSAT